MKILASLFLITFSVYLFAEVNIQGTPSEVEKFLERKPDPEVIVLQGIVSDIARLDSAQVITVIEVKENQLNDTIAKAQSILNQIKSTLIDAGFGEKDIVSDSYSSTPNYGFFSRKTPSSYSIVNKVNITISNDAEFIEVAKIIDAITELRFSNIEINSEFKEVAKQAALDQAIANLKEQVSYYESQFGIQLEFRRFDVQFNNDVNQTNINLLQVEQDEGWFEYMGSARKRGYDLTLIEQELNCVVKGTYFIRDKS